MYPRSLIRSLVMLLRSSGYVVRSYSKPNPSWAEVVNRNRRMGFGGGCTAARLSNAGPACKDMLDLGISLGRTGIMLYEFKDGSTRCPG